MGFAPEVTPNLQALADTVAHTEGTDRVPDPYRCCEGYTHTIVSFADHPYPTEWGGSKISSGRYAGELTTAAGKYQINHPTFIAMKAQLRTTGFAPEVQDDMFVQLLKDHGAFAFVTQGKLEAALPLLANTWASLPGGGSGQREFLLGEVIELYRQKGGELA